jgi:copper chaperone CopZ
MIKSTLKTFLALLALATGTGALAAEKKSKGKQTEGAHPNPVERTFYISGISSQREVDKINAAVAKLPSVTAVQELTPASGYVRVSFDTHAIFMHLIAQAIMDQGPFAVTQKFQVSDYPGNAEKLDALFAKLRAERQVKIEPVDKAKGQFLLTFLPIKPDPADPRKVGFNPGHLGHAIHDAPPKGLGLTIKNLEAPPRAAR